MAKSILVSSALPADALRIIPGEVTVDYNDTPAELSKAELIARLRGKDGLICHIISTIDDEVLAAAPTVKVVANVAVGYNNIDLAAARRRGVVVTNTPDVLTETTADFTWALLMATARPGRRRSRAGPRPQGGLDRRRRARRLRRGAEDPSGPRAPEQRRTGAAHRERLVRHPPGDGVARRPQLPGRPRRQTGADAGAVTDAGDDPVYCLGLASGHWVHSSQPSSTTFPLGLRVRPRAQVLLVITFPAS